MSGPPVRSGRPVPSVPPDREATLWEIGQLAEEAARLRAQPAPAIGVPRAESRPDVSAADVEASLESRSRPPAPGTRAPGLRALDDLPELERAILYAEILGPPKALRSEEEEPW